MDVNNFETQVDTIILQRGYDYYSQGNIVETYEQGDNEYILKVEGSKDYEVTVQLDKNGEILYSECDCPYNFGPICKHEIAAYFELRDILNSGSNNKDMGEKVSKLQGIKEVLGNLSKKELIEVIVDITKKDSTLSNSIIFRYSKGNNIDELGRCKKLMNSIVRKYMGREGFIDYRHSIDFANEMLELLDKVDQTYRVNHNFLLALDISVLILEESIEAFQYSDDSN